MLAKLLHAFRAYQLEAARLLPWFDMPFYVDMACHAEFQDRAYKPAISILMEAKHRGFIREFEGSKPIIHDRSVFGCELMLTDAGREWCGLETAEAVEKPTKKSKQETLQKELF